MNDGEKRCTYAKETWLDYVSVQDYNGKTKYVLDKAKAVCPDKKVRTVRLNPRHSDNGEGRVYGEVTVHGKHIHGYIRLIGGFDQTYIAFFPNPDGKNSYLLERRG